MPAPSTSAVAPSGKTTIVSGTVYDETAATVDGAVVKVTSLDASVPYTASTTTSQGSWVVNSVPEGANVEIVVTKDGWTARRRVGSFQTNANQKNTVDFGGTGATTGSNTDTSGVAYFISKYPEIQAVDPAYDSTNVDPSTVSYKITLSEPLDSTNQNRFANSVRIFPANTQAAPDNDGYGYPAAAANQANGYAGGTSTIAAGTAVAVAANSEAMDSKTTPAALGAGSTLPLGMNFFDLKDQRVAPFRDTGAGVALNLDRPVDPDPNKGYSTSKDSSGTLTAPTGAGAADFNNAGSATSHPVEGICATGSGNVATSNVPWDYSIKNGTLFLNDANTRSNISWDATGTVATLTFNAPLCADRTNQARYQMGLVSQSQSDRIVDKDNNQLGVSASGNQSSYPVVGALIHATVKQPDLSLDTTKATDGPTRWIGTHQDAARFAMKVDNIDPKLAGVAYTKNINQSSRFELTFTKPMAAYNGRLGGHVGSALVDGSVLGKITFAVSDRTGGTTNINLKRDTATLGLDASKSGATKFGANASDIEKEFYLASTLPGTNTNMGISLTSTPSSYTNAIFAYGVKDIRTVENSLPTGLGKYLIAINPSNAKTIFVYIVGQTSVFDQKIVELKVRAEAVPDPSGNTIKSSDADANEKTSSVQ